MIATITDDDVVPWCNFLCVLFAGYDVLGGEETCAQGSGSSERPGKITQSYKDHRLWSGSALGCK